MNENPISCLFLDCTIKPSPQPCYTDYLIEASQSIMATENVEIETIRPVDFTISHLMSSDPHQQTTDDDWSQISEKIFNADILVLSSPTWLANISSVAIKVLERLYSQASRPNKQGQYIFYNKVAGVLANTEDEDSLQAGSNTLRTLANIGFIVPPDLNAPWIDNSQSDLSWPAERQLKSNNNVHIMSWNLMRMAGKIKLTGNLYDEAAHA